MSEVPFGWFDLSRVGVEGTDRELVVCVNGEGTSRVPVHGLLSPPGVGSRTTFVSLTGQDSVVCDGAGKEGRLGYYFHGRWKRRGRKTGTGWEHESTTGTYTSVWGGELSTLVV